LTAARFYRDTRGQYAEYEKLTAEDKQQLYADLTLLAESLAQLRAELKIDVYYKYRNEP
jgi:iron uptake system component EfeO